jgi:alpha-tubulin suppressor-like RCC1 family protein
MLNTMAEISPSRLSIVVKPGLQVRSSPLGATYPRAIARALTAWLTVACGEYFTLAAKTDGTMWTWGENNYGQLGLGNTTGYSSPKQVGSLTNWLNIAGNRSSAIAVASPY